LLETASLNDFEIFTQTVNDISDCLLNNAVNKFDKILCIVLKRATHKALHIKKFFKCMVLYMKFMALKLHKNINQGITLIFLLFYQLTNNLVIFFYLSLILFVDFDGLNIDMSSTIVQRTLLFIGLNYVPGIAALRMIFSDLFSFMFNVILFYILNNCIQKEFVC